MFTELCIVGKIPSTVSFIELNINQGAVTVRHTDCAEISVNASSPGNWNIEENTILQSASAPYVGEELEVIVPENYGGGLVINYEGGSRIHLDYWCGGDLFIASYQGGDLTCGCLSALSSLVLQTTGAGNFNIEKIETDNFVASKSGAGGLKIGNLRTGTFLLTQSGCGSTSIVCGGARSGSSRSEGSGEIELNGDFGSVNQLPGGSPGRAKILIFE